jgi:SpoVK/Ycf46/Vps4 family AAA+-type ATPase
MLTYADVCAIGEVDAVTRSRGFDSAGVRDSVVAQLLARMDGALESAVVKQ